MRKSSVLLLAALLASVASAAWLWSELLAERARNAELGAQLRRQFVETTRVAESAPNPLPQSATVPGTRSEPAAPAAPIASDTRHVQGTAAEWQGYQRRLMQDPRYREARREQNRLSLAPRRANFIRLFGLTPEQADAVIDLRLDQEMRWQLELPQDPVAEGYGEKQQAVMEAAEREYQDKVRALLGEDKRARLQDYMESRASRMQVDTFRTQLHESDALRDDQVEPLIAALHAERSQFQDDMEEYRKSLSWEGDTAESSRRFGEKQIQLMKAMTSRMRSSASAILSRTQLDTLDSVLQRELARFEAEQRMQRLQSKLDLGGTPSSPN